MSSFKVVFKWRIEALRHMEWAFWETAYVPEREWPHGKDSHDLP
jgi:hypothetical protein